MITMSLGRRPFYRLALFIKRGKLRSRLMKDRRLCDLVFEKAWTRSHAVFCPKVLIIVHLGSGISFALITGLSKQRNITMKLYKYFPFSAEKVANKIRTSSRPSRPRSQSPCSSRLYLTETRPFGSLLTRGWGDRCSYDPTGGGSSAWELFQFEYRPNTGAPPQPPRLLFNTGPVSKQYYFQPFKTSKSLRAYT